MQAARLPQALLHEAMNLMASDVQDLEKLRQEAMKRVFDAFENGGEFGLAQAFVYRIDGHLDWMMLDVEVQQQRRAIQRACAEHPAWLVHHIQECWQVSASHEDPAAVAALDSAARERSLDRHPDRREVMIFTEESISTPVRQWCAVIDRESSGNPLGQWDEMTLRLPRPGFKRYLPETGRSGI